MEWHGITLMTGSNYCLGMSITIAYFFFLLDNWTGASPSHYPTNWSFESIIYYIVCCSLRVTAQYLLVTYLSSDVILRMFYVHTYWSTICRVCCMYTCTVMGIYSSHSLVPVHSLRVMMAAPLHAPLTTPSSYDSSKCMWSCAWSSSQQIMTCCAG